MKKAILFFMVWLLVLAVPLIATPVSDNTGNKVLATSLFDKEVSLTEQVLMYDHVAILAVGMKQRWLPIYNDSTKIYIQLIKSGTKAFNRFNKELRGGSRIKSGSH